MTNALYYGDTRTARCVCACVGSAIFLLATLGASADDTKRVLMLHFFDRDVKPWSAYAKNIRAELEQQSRWPLEISDHSLMPARSNAEAGAGWRARFNRPQETSGHSGMGLARRWTAARTRLRRTLRPPSSCAQCRLGPLRKRLRSPEVTRTSNVRPSR